MELAAKVGLAIHMASLTVAPGENEHPEARVGH